MQQRSFYRSYVSYLNFILQKIESQLQNIFASKKVIPEAEIETIVSTVVTKEEEELLALPLLPGMTEGYLQEIPLKYTEAINRAMAEVFEQLPLTDDSKNRLRRIAGHICCRDRFPTNTSGIVIAGFGEKDTFPSMVSFQLDRIASDRLKYKQDRSLAIDFDVRASVHAFAQREMVAAFMEGIDPRYKTTMGSYLREIFDKYPGVICDQLADVSVTERSKLRTVLENQSRALFETFLTRMGEYERAEYVGPVTAAVANLPKDELAAMAESLVSLTSFKRRVTMDAETVGGPIDVAVISKGDGFIWIKRKHYFRPELNPQFFANYYRRGKSDGSDQEG